MEPDNKTPEATSDSILSDLTEEDFSILEHRARELSRAIIEDDEEGEYVQVLTFMLSGELFAVRTESVRIVRPLKSHTRVPCSPDFVMGVTNLRGNILSIIDLRRFFGLPSQALSEMRYFIVISAAMLEVGIVVNQVGEVLNMPRDSFMTAPTTLDSVRQDYMEGVSTDGLILLDFENILGDPRMIVEM